MANAIILCSGGIDSVVTAHYVKKKKNYKKILILFFNYGQRTLEQEKRASKKCAENLNAKFKEIELLELGKISTSMINSNDKANEMKKEDLKDTKEESENWYVPCRNIVFLVYALAVAEARFVSEGEVNEIFVGFKNEGDEAYPDTTPEFVDVMNKLQETATAGKFEIIAPFIRKDKEDIIKLGAEMGIDFKETYTCYVGAGEKHCGTCLSCKLRQEGFYWSGVEDKTEYED